jgi:ubiquinone/menaquinone biosynthesis C-methylase UbiE
MADDRGHPVFAWCYDRMSRAEERAGMGEHRRELLANATGRVVEIGAGTGLNFPHYPAAVSEVAAIEPDRHMRRRAVQAAEAEGLAVPVEVRRASAESLPYGDGEFDTAVSTLVLCSVSSPERALAELRRVLKPEGVLLFFEHVRSQDPRAGRWQDRLDRPWGWIAGGCHPNRDTVANIERAGFTVTELRRFAWGPPSPGRPHVRGTAVR